MDKKDSARMRELCDILDKASKAYYQGKDELMSNFQYDRLYDELTALEKKTGVVLNGSPTEKVGYEVISELPKMTHPSPMLSLDKTKSVAELKNWLGSSKGLLSWKMDGLTVVLTYDEGRMTQAVTRGNGITGEVITPNARTFKNIPLTIPFKGHLVLRGEAVIPYSVFFRINSELPPEDQYKNPRNLCSGSVRQLDSSITAERDVNFFAFSLVECTEKGEDGRDIPGHDFKNSNEEKYKFMADQGFKVVGYREVTGDTIDKTVQEFSDAIKGNDFPSDGLVLLLDDISYGESLGKTAKFPRNSIAFKWQDETAVTILRKVEWNASRTGLINPVAVFDPVELEGTTVSRASVHNLSIVKELHLGIGDHIKVYKANMIIPQIAENITQGGNLEIPGKCPVCGTPTEVRTDHESSVLVCPNPECPAKKLNSFVLFVSRDAMNIDGLSKSGLEKLIARGIIKDYADLFTLDRHHDEITAIEGMGEKAYEKLVKAAEAAKNVETAKFIYALGIPNVGLSTARLVCDHFHNNTEDIFNASTVELEKIEGIGNVTAEAFRKYFDDKKNMNEAEKLLKMIKLTNKEESSGVYGDSSGGSEGAAKRKTLQGLVFVITGSVNHFKNRSELKDEIVKRGGKASESVSKNTDYLINNDVTSTSSKNRKARELGIPVISEEDFIKKFDITP